MVEDRFYITDIVSKQCYTDSEIKCLIYSYVIKFESLTGEFSNSIIINISRRNKNPSRRLEIIYRLKNIYIKKNIWYSELSDIWNLGLFL